MNDWPEGSGVQYAIGGSTTSTTIDRGRLLRKPGSKAHIAAGTTVPETMKKHLDARRLANRLDHRLANLAAPVSAGWSVPQALQVLSWLSRRPIAQASAS